MRWLVKHGLYLSINVIESKNNESFDLFLCYTCNGIGFNKEWLLIYDLSCLENFIIPNIVHKNVNVLYTPYGFVLSKSETIIELTEHLKSIPKKLLALTINLYISYGSKMYSLLRNILRNTDDISLFEIDGKVMDKSGSFVSSTYEGLTVNREYYYRLLIKYVFPYLNKI